MRVQCQFCEHEKSGFCIKKARGGKSLKVKGGKRRTCSSYKEDAGKLVADFRRRERNRALARTRELTRLRTGSIKQATAAPASQGSAYKVAEPKGTEQ